MTTETYRIVWQESTGKTANEEVTIFQTGFDASSYDDALSLFLKGVREIVTVVCVYGKEWDNEEYMPGIDASPEENILCIELWYG